MSVFKEIKRDKINSLNEFFLSAMRGSFLVAKQTNFIMFIKVNIKRMLIC